MALAPYRTVAAPAEDEFTEKKSRFIGYIAPVTTEQEAAAFIESVPATTATPIACGRIISPAFRMTASHPAPQAAPFWRSSSGRS